MPLETRSCLLLWSKGKDFARKSFTPRKNKEKENVDCPEENLPWEPKAKSRSVRLGEPPRAPGLPKKNATRSATLLQELSECQRKAFLRIKKNPERLDPSPFARQKFADGTAFEEKMMEGGTTSRAASLIQSKFPMEGLAFENLNTDGTKTFSPSIRAKIHQERLQEITATKTPTLLYQIQIEEPGNSQESQRGGIADLALWTGSHWILGEIKATSRPKTAAALQLYHYREIWKKWAPAGETVSKEIFILHCREGWQFEKGIQKREQDCIRFSQITTFNIPFAKSAYEQAWEELKALESTSSEPHAEFCVHCTECPHRLTCYRDFAQQAESEAGLGPAFAGFDEAEILWLKDQGIETITKTLDSLDSLEELHKNNPQVKKELKRRLRMASLLGGCSTWAPPPNSEEHQILFYCRSPQNEPSRPWKFQGANPQDEAPNPNPGTLLVAFSQSEMQSGLARLKAAKGATLQGVKAICLQNELEAETLFPYENLSLRGTVNTLEGVMNANSWAEHARKNLIPWLESTLKNPKEEYGNKQERIFEVERLWQVMKAIHSLMPPL